MRHRIAAWSILIAALTLLVSAGALAATDRNEAPPEHKWDFSHIYPDFDAWKADYDRIVGIDPPGSDVQSCQIEAAVLAQILAGNVVVAAARTVHQAPSGRA